MIWPGTMLSSVLTFAHRRKEIYFFILLFFNCTSDETFSLTGVEREYVWRKGSAKGVFVPVAEDRSLKYKLLHQNRKAILVIETIRPQWHRV